MKRAALIAVGVGWLLYAFYLTTSATGGRRLVDTIASLVGPSPWIETVGHAFVFGMLTTTLYLLLQIRLSHTLALTIAAGVALVAGASTELYQGILPTRTVSWRDMAGNITGVALCATTIFSIRKVYT